MTASLDVLNIAQAVAARANNRQSVIAANIANADTPGYRARDIAPFSLDTSDNGPVLKTTRDRHVQNSSAAPTQLPTFVEKGEQSPNGNSVSLEQEMAKASELRLQYDLALGVYRKSMDILRASVGR
jgi:flagellar basal-body rod protein FlgB